MGRRTSGARVGLEKIGNVQASAATLTTTQANADLTLAPNGTGSVVISNATTVASNFTIQAQNQLRLSEASANGTNYIAIQAAANMASNYTITWPAAVSGGSGYVLSSDSSGNLSWTSPSSLSIPVSDPGSVSTVHYPIFATNAGSIPSSLSPAARSNLSFVPSTGELTATALLAANAYGSTSNSGTLTLRGTTSATKASASVLMTDGVASSSTTTGTLVVTGGIGASGQITCATLSATTLTETSSIALKENFRTIDNALDKILQLTGWIYDRKDGSTVNEAGVVAEEVNKVIPNIVKKDSEGNPESVAYTRLVAYMIEAIKELKSEIVSLKGK